MKLLELCLLFGVLVVQTLARTGSSQHNRVSTSKKLSACPVGEIRKTCHSKCEPTCFSHAKCATVCTPVAVCACQDGFVRHEGICIPQAACQFFARPSKKTQQKPQPKPIVKKSKPTTKTPLKRKATTKAKPATPPPEIIIKPAHPPPSCGRGQAFTLCVCDASCDTGKVCKSCKSGCGCFRHFVRDSNGDCIAFEQCPAPRPPSKPMAIIDLTDEKPGGSQAEGIKTLILTSDNFHARIPQHEAEHFLRQMNTRTLANVSHSLDHKSERHRLASALLENSISLRQPVESEPTRSPHLRQSVASESTRPPQPQLAQRQPFTELLTTLRREFFPTKHLNLTRRARRLRHRKRSSHGKRRRDSFLNSFLRLSKAREVDSKADSLTLGDERGRTFHPTLLREPVPPPTPLLRKESLKSSITKSPMSPAIKPVETPAQTVASELGPSFAKPTSAHLLGPISPAKHTPPHLSGPISPALHSPPHISNPISSAKFSSPHLSGPVPPATVRKLREKGRGMPPGKMPPNFGPPAMTPFVFFREKRVQRRQKKLDEMKAKFPFLPKVRS